jgi:hypothetical protein
MTDKQLMAVALRHYAHVLRLDAETAKNSYASADALKLLADRCKQLQASV